MRKQRAPGKCQLVLLPHTLQAVANSEVDPLSRNLLASPDALLRVQVVVAKVFLVVCCVGVNVSA